MEKWKTYPCKYCILKGKCSKKCFEFPPAYKITDHIIQNKLSQTCLCCGSKYNEYSYVQWNCDNCKQ